MAELSGPSMQSNCGRRICHRAERGAPGALVVGGVLPIELLLPTHGRGVENGRDALRTLTDS